MRRKFLLVSFFFPYLSFAQNALKGLIQINDRPTEMVQIYLSINGHEAGQTTSDSLGLFRFDNLKQEKYTIHITFANFVDTSSTVVLKNDTILNFNLKNISANKLKEVIVKAQSPVLEKRIDRIVFNVLNQIGNAGGDVTELLKKTPYVLLRNEEISLIGKSSVGILINDKLINLDGSNLLEFLKTISSSSVAKIEVITNPPARYDAEGNSGLINIVLKKRGKYNLFNGNLETGYEQRSLATSITNAGFALKRNNFYFTTNLRGVYGKTSPVEAHTFRYPSQMLSQIDSRVDDRKYLLGRISADDQISKTVGISIQYAGVISHPSGKEEIVSNYSNAGLIDSSQKTFANQLSNLFYHSLDFGSVIKLDTNASNVQFDVSYFQWGQFNYRPFTNEFISALQLKPTVLQSDRTTGNQKIYILSSTLDFDLHKKSTSYSFGVKTAEILNRSSNSFSSLANGSFVINPNLSNSFKYNETTSATYFTADRTFSPVEIKIGARGEYTSTFAQQVSNLSQLRVNYFRIYPTLFLNYKINDSNSVSLSYGRRIERPGFRLLNPFRWYLNASTFVEGNPFLKPDYFHNIELSYLLNNNLNSSVYFSYEKDGFDQISIPNSNGSSITVRPFNFFNQVNVGINENYQLVYRRFNSNLAAYVYYSKTSSHFKSGNQSYKVVSGSIDLLNSIKLNRSGSFSGEINLTEQFPQVIGVSRIGSSTNLEVGIKSSFFNNKLLVNLLVDDIFRKSIPVIRSFVAGVTEHFANYYDNRFVRINFNYVFGKNKSVQKDFPKVDDSERKRAN